MRPRHQQVSVHRKHTLGTVTCLHACATDHVMHHGLCGGTLADNAKQHAAAHCSTAQHMALGANMQWVSTYQTGEIHHIMYPRKCHSGTRHKTAQPFSGHAGSSPPGSQQACPGQRGCPGRGRSCHAWQRGTQTVQGLCAWPLALYRTGHQDVGMMYRSSRLWAFFQPPPCSRVGCSGLHGPPNSRLWAGGSDRLGRHALETGEVALASTAPSHNGNGLVLTDWRSQSRVCLVWFKVVP